MLYLLFKNSYLKIWKKIGASDVKRLKEQTLYPDIKEECFSYINDNKSYHKLNIYQPQNNFVSLPLIIDIHGGGWAGGNKDTNKKYNYYLASKDNIVISMSFADLSNHKKLIDMIQDIFASLQWIYENKNKLNYDETKIMLTGDSSGAHLAFLVASIQNNRYLQGIFNVKHVKLDFSCLVLTHPAVSIKEYIELMPQNPYSFISVNMNKALKRMLLGFNYKKKPIFNAFSSEDILKINDEYPPILITTSQGDIALHPLSVRLAKDLKNNDIDFDYYDDKNKENNHAFNIIDPDNNDSKKMNDYILKFFINNAK